MGTRSLPLMGRIAVHLKLITHDQLSELTRLQEREGHRKNLGDLMVDQGLIDASQLRRLVAAQKQVFAKQRAQQAAAQADPEPEMARTPVRTPRPATPPPRGPAPAPRTEKSAPVERVAAKAPPPQETRAKAPPPVASGQLTDLLRAGVERGASDIHIHSGMPLRLRLHGRFEAHGDQPVRPEHAEALVRSALTPDQQALFDARGEIDLAYHCPELGRFRANVFRQQRGVDAVFRYVPPRPPTLDELGLPNSLARLTNFHQGLVLLTGPANCGKSSTLAALVRILNEERRDHILTIEDPIEYVHVPERCVVNQRSVGSHTESFARALRAALREDPDVIVIGELRDFETISLALTAAETGHLVLGTLHTNNAIPTINRIVGVFPADQQEQVRSMVSESLRAVVSQRLVPTADGSRRVPALEVLMMTRSIGNLLRENKTFQIFSQLQMGGAQGMCLLDDSLNALVADGTITREEALRQAYDAKRIKG
jgi:twitching motility protein PilT